MPINKNGKNRTKPFEENINYKIKKNFIENSYYKLQKGFECKKDSKGKSNFTLNTNSMESIKSKKLLKKRKFNEENKENINSNLNDVYFIEEEEKMQISDKSNNNYQIHKYSDKNYKDSCNKNLNRSLLISNSKMQISESKMEFQINSKNKILENENFENIKNMINLEIPINEDPPISKKKEDYSINFSFDNYKDLKDFEFLRYIPKEKQILFAINNLCEIMLQENNIIDEEDNDNKYENIFYGKSSLIEQKPLFLNLKENSNLQFKNSPSLNYKKDYNSNLIKELERKKYKFQNLQKNLMKENTLNFFRNSNFSYLKNFSKKRKTINLQIIKSNVSLNSISTSFIITSDGLASSQRSKNNEYISIGRQQINDDGIRPNDIMLFPTDPSISRSHFKILYKSFFFEQNLFFEKLQILLNILYTNYNGFGKYQETYSERMNDYDYNYGKEFYNYVSNCDEKYEKIKSENFSKLINLENVNDEIVDNIKNDNCIYKNPLSLFLENCFETKEKVKNNTYSFIKDKLTISQKETTTLSNIYKNSDEKKNIENEFNNYDNFNNSKHKKNEIPNFLKKISPSIIHDIVKYLAPKQEVLIEDNSTIYGTYVRVKPFSIDNLINNIFLIYKTLNIYNSVNNFNFENSLHIILNNQKEFKNVAAELYKNISYDNTKPNILKCNTSNSSLDNNLNEIAIKLDLNNKIIIGDCNLENYFFYNLENLNLLKNLRMKYLYKNMDLNNIKCSQENFEQPIFQKKIYNKLKENNLIDLNVNNNKNKINSNFSFLDSEMNNFLELDEISGQFKEENNLHSKEFSKNELSEFEILHEKFKKFTLENSKKEYRFSYDFNYGKPYDYLINKLSEEEKHLQEYKFMMNPNNDEIIHFPSYFKNIQKKFERVNNKNLEKELFLLFLNKKKIDFLLKNFQNESFNLNNKDSILKKKKFKNMNNSSKMVFKYKFFLSL